MTNELHTKLLDIQQTLEAPKDQHNAFGNYNYRSCEDILNAVKPLLKKHGLTLILTDTVINHGDRYYVQATAVLSDGVNTYTNSAFAREQQAKFNKEGRETMDHAQITGSTSSYARKYALNGLFAIDDTKDADTMDNTSHAKTPSKPQAEKDPTEDWGTHETPAKALGNCAKCGAPNAWSVKSNKAYCSALCWKK